MREQETKAVSRLGFNPWLPVAALAGVIAVLYLVGPATKHESATLLFALNLVFTTLVSLLIVVLGSRGFLATGRPALLAITTGMLVWGVSALVAVAGRRVGNYNITIHNLGVLTSGACHLIGAVISLKRGRLGALTPGAWLPAAIVVGLGAVYVIWMATRDSWLPPFFVDGLGGTPLRTAVLAASIAMFGVSGVLTWARYRDTGWRFLGWYGPGLVLIGLGALGLLLQPTHGSWLGWAARGTQYLGGVYMLVGAFVTAREVGGWQLTLEERLARTERLAREQAELIRTVNDSTSELIFTKDRSGRLMYANAATLRMVGREAVGGVPDSELFRAPAEHAAIAKNDRFVLESGSVVEAEEPYTGADGETRLFLSTKSPLRDDQGRIVGTICVSRDITERKRAEQAALEANRKLEAALSAAVRAEAELRRHREHLEQLVEERTAALRESTRKVQEAQRLAALGNMAAGIGHDIANMTFPIRARLEPLARELDSADAKLDIAAIGKSIEYLTNLSAGLRLMALDPERDAASSAVTDLAGWIAQAEPVLRNALPQGVAFSLELATPGPTEPLPGVPMAAHRLTQVVYNLVQNAGEAIAGARVKSGWVRLSVRAVTSVIGRPNMVEIAVSDNGPGIAPEHRARVFEPFFTTKVRAIATGMGLGMVRGLIESAGGSVRVESTPDGGATFTVSLPAAARAAAPQRETPGRRAAVTLPDARRQALVEAILAGLGVDVANGTPSPSGNAENVQSAPAADIWVASNPQARTVEIFLAGASRRRMVLMDAGGGPAGSDGDRRVVRVPEGAGIATLRDALVEVASMPSATAEMGE